MNTATPPASTQIYAERAKPCPFCSQTVRIRATANMAHDLWVPVWCECGEAFWCVVRVEKVVCFDVVPDEVEPGPLDVF